MEHIVLRAHRCVRDRKRGLLVVRMVKESSLGDIDALIDVLDSIYDRTQITRDLVIIFAIDAKVPAIGSVQRRHLAEARARTFARDRELGATRRTLAGLVTPSLVFRGVATAMNWIHPEPQLVHEAFAGFDEAVQWAEALRGEPLPLRQLYAQAFAPY